MLACAVLVGDAAESEQALNEAAGFLRNGLFKRLAIHTVPKGGRFTLTAPVVACLFMPLD